MKVKTTRKYLNDRYKYIICVGADDLQYLLNYKTPSYYCTRVEGWACDNYDVDGILISAGYSPLKQKNTTRDFNIVCKYEDAARKIVLNYDINWEDQKKELEKLLNQFITECKLG